MLRQAISEMLHSAVRAYVWDEGGAGCMMTVGMLTCADEHQASAEELADMRRTFATFAASGA